MSTVNHIITREWRRLPETVLGYPGFTNPESRAPTMRVVRTILPTLLAKTADGYRFSARHWQRRYELSDRIAAAIAERLAGAGERLSAAVGWHEELLDAYDEWVDERGSEPADSPHEWLMGPSLALATRLGDRGDGARDEARAEMSRKAGPSRGPSAKDVQRYLRREARRLDAELDELWADGYRGVEPVSPPLREALDRYHRSAFAAQNAEWSAADVGRDEALAAWDQIVAAADAGVGATLGELSASSPPGRPALRGTARTKDSRPLDRAIADRLTRMFKGADAVVVQPLAETGPMNAPSFAETSARAIVEDTIRDSPEPFGLSQASARALLLIIHRMTEPVSWQPDRRSREIVARQYPAPSDQYFIREWQRVGWNRRAAAQPGSTLGRMLESPGALFLGRMWTRAARTQFQEAEWRPDARMAWDHAAGVFRSIVEDAPSLYHYSQQTGRTVSFDDTRPAGDAGDEPEDEPAEEVVDAEVPGASAGAFATIVDEILDIGRLLDGDDAVMDFRFSTEDGEDAPRARWDAWVEVSTRDPADIPDFDQVQQYLMRTAGSDDASTPAPTLENVLEVTDFISRRGTEAREAVNALLRHVAQEPDIAPDDPRAATWDRWSERYASHRLELDGVRPPVITFEQMARLVRAGLGPARGAGSV